jgi:hypothetical protein
MKYIGSDILTNGLAHAAARAAAGDTITLHLLAGYELGDSYATVVSNSLGSVALAAGDVPEASATGGRKVTLATKSLTASASSQQYDQGTASAGGAATLTDSTQSWSTNAHAGRVVKITGGTGAGQIRRIASNTGTVLTLAAALTDVGDGTVTSSANWTTPPDNTSTYVILDDLHLAIVNTTASQVYFVTDINNDQVVTAGNTQNMPSVSWTQKNQAA